MFGNLARPPERGAPGGSWAARHDRRRSLPVAFSKNSLYLFLPARQITRPHGYSDRPWRAVDGPGDSYARKARAAADRQHDADDRAIGSGVGRGPADDVGAGEAGRTGTAV